jgi:hypothetical protein
MDPRHRQLAEIALQAAGSAYGLALAGGYAVRAHGMGDRPSGDVDLFTDWQRRADFPAVADRVIKAFTDTVLWSTSMLVPRPSPGYSSPGTTSPMRSHRRWSWPPTGAPIRRST